MAAFFLGVFLWGAGHGYLKRREERREREAASSAKQLGIAAERYLQDHQDRFPDAGRWEQELMPYLGPNAKILLHPPAPIGGKPRRFALNLSLSGKLMGTFKSPADTPLFFESVSTTLSASDNLDSTPTDKDGGNRYAVVYADGHVYSQPPEWKQWAKQHPDGAGATLLGDGQMN